MSEGPRKRRWGEGSLFWSPFRKRWIGAYVSKATGKRRVMVGHEWQPVEEWLDASVKLSVRPRTTYRLTVKTRRVRAELWITRILDEAIAQSWVPDQTARVIIAQLAPRRLRDNIFGPCVYCGSWVAGTIDHVIPQVQGGTDSADNLVSACLNCNSRKGPRTPQEWAA